MVLHFSGSKTWFEAFGQTSCGPPDFWWNPRTVLGYIRMCIPILVLLEDFSVCLKMGDTPSCGQFNRDNDDNTWESIGAGSTLFSDKPLFLRIHSRPFLGNPQCNSTVTFGTRGSYAMAVTRGTGPWFFIVLIVQVIFDLFGKGLKPWWSSKGSKLGTPKMILKMPVLFYRENNLKQPCFNQWILSKQPYFNQWIAKNGNELVQKRWMSTCFGYRRRNQRNHRGDVMGHEGMQPTIFLVSRNWQSGKNSYPMVN